MGTHDDRVPLLTVVRCGGDAASRPLVYPAEHRVGPGVGAWGGGRKLLGGFAASHGDGVRVAG
jgi:hypothetical protein